MLPLYDISISDMLKYKNIYIYLKINAGLALLKSFRSLVLSLRGLSKVFFCLFFVFFLIHGGNYLGLHFANLIQFHKILNLKVILSDDLDYSSSCYS